MKWSERIAWIVICLACLAASVGYHEHRKAMLECEAAGRDQQSQLADCLEKTERVPEAFCVNAGPVDPDAPPPPKKSYPSKLKVGTKPSEGVK